MTPSWQDVGCASIPARDLSVLADLRRLSGIRVSIEGERAWIAWESGSESTRRVLVDRLLPLPGVEMFARRAGRWYRPGDSLPAFHVPIGDGSGGIALEGVIFPRPMTASAPSGEAPEPIALRLLRDGATPPRPAAAVRCRLDRLADWADRETSARIASLSASWLPGPDDAPEKAEVLVLGDAGTLPVVPGGSRYWGASVLIPIGFRVEPELSEAALRHLVGAATEDLVILDASGHERIPRSAFRPLSRAAIRLAGAGRPQGGPRP